MAEYSSETMSPVEAPVPENEKKLKYLDFVEGAAIYAFVCLSTLYDYAKENAGPLKPGVQTVEGTVKTVIGPVCQKFHDVPFQLLSFVDRKVGESVDELGRHVPSLVKRASSQIFLAAQKAPALTRDLTSEVERAGLVDAAGNIAKAVYSKYEPTAKELYVRYEPAAEQYAVSSWAALNRLSLFPQVAHIMIPTAAYWAERYNEIVGGAAHRGYTASNYLPLVPIEKIAGVFENARSPH